MSAAPRPDTEAARLEALRQYRILDTPAEEAFDDLARLAIQICEVPIGLVAFLDQDRQWFKARVGLDVCETPRDAAPCAHTILGHDLLIVPDTARDPRSADSPLVTGPPYVRFYAGMPLCSPEGLTVGTLCVLDTTPRQLTGAQQSALVRLGRLVVGQLELRRKGLELAAPPGRLQRTLGQLGASVEGAACLGVALDAVTTHRARGAPFDFVLLDDSAAGPDLETGIRHLTTHPAFTGARLILLQPTTQRPTESWLAALGVSALVRKPIRLEELRMALMQTPATVTPPAAAPTVPGSPTPIPSGLTVLVVDDNSVNQKVAARMLAKLGCVVEIAAHGREALEMVMRTPYAVVFMDCMMPEMDGYEATCAIRKLDGPAARTPIVAMTANAMQGDRERCLAAGMDDYLSKPVQPELLRQALERWGAPVRAPEPGAAPPVDPNVLGAFRQLQETGGPDIVTEFIDRFLADLPVRREAIMQSLSEGDTERTGSAAHGLNRSATYIGAQELARICLDLETAARRGDTEQCARTGMALEEEMQRVTQYLQSARQRVVS